MIRSTPSVRANRMITSDGSPISATRWTEIPLNSRTNAPFKRISRSRFSSSIPVDMDELKRDLEIRLNGAFVREFNGISVQRVAEIGDPSEVIMRFARTEGVDLIIMPTHGYG